jgi:hypothetical protein
MRHLLGFGLAALVLAGCATRGPECAVDRDCASGQCGADGVCAPATAADAAASIGEGDAAGTGRCLPDHDGAITQGEVSVALGAEVTFRVARDAPVDTRGALDRDGARVWDLDRTFTGDDDAPFGARPIAGEWFAPRFPEAEFAARMTGSADLLGVFTLAADALVLHGLVSPEGGLARTELVYDPPIDLLRLPLAAGVTWRSESWATGLVGGVVTTYQETWDQEVDAEGTLRAPIGAFPVLRVRSDLRQAIGLAATTRRTYLFVAECYGTVATMVSDPGETSPEFTRAAEVRRLVQ